MYSLFVLISVLFFVTPSIGTLVYSTFPQGQTTYDKFTSFLNVLTTVDSNGVRVVHSSGGAAGGIVSEGQGYGVYLGATVAASLATTDSRYAGALTTAYQLFLGWKAMCKGSTVGNSCQASYYCPDTTANPVTYYPCLPHWKFNDQLGNWEYGSATDGDIDGITGTCILAAATMSNKPSWWTDVANWCYASAKQFYDYGVEQDTVGGVAEAVLKLGSCWGGLSCTNPSYFSPGHYRIIRNLLTPIGNALAKPASEINTYVADYDKLILSSYKIIISNQNTAGLTTNWYIPNSADLSQPGAVNTNCDGSGTPVDQFGAEAARGVFRVAEDYILFQSPSAHTYLSKIVKQLTTKFSGSSFGSLDTGGFVNSVFASWQSTAFIYGPTFCALVDDLGISNQAAARSAAVSTIAAGSISEYYAGSWTVLSTLAMSGDLAKIATFVGGTPPGPQAPVAPAPVAPVPPPVAPVAPVPPPVAPVTPTAPAPVAPKAPSSRTCTLKGCSINLYYIEFVTTATSVKTANILCSDGRTIACTLSSGKYTCPITDNKSCLKPTPQLDGAKCPFTIPTLSQACASGSGTNSWWVEFVPPNPASYDAKLGAVLCADGRYDSCVDGSGKLNCAIKENACSNPVPLYDGSFCLFPGTTAASIPAYSIVDDSSSISNTSSMPSWAITFIIVGCIVVVIVLVVTVWIIRRKRTREEIV